MIAINNVFLYLTIIPTVLNAWIILYIVRVLPGNRMTGLFNLFVISLFLWQLETIIINFTETESAVIYWDKILSVGWISCAPLILHFACRFTGLKLLSKPFNLLLAYVPFIIFHQLHIARVDGHFSFDPTWGWIHHTPPGSSEALLRYTMAFYVMTSVVILFRHAYVTRKDKMKRMQAYLIAIGISIPALQGIITQVIFPFVLHRDEIPLTTTFLTFFSAATLISLSRFRMFNISDSVKVETVLANLKNLVIFISPDQKILYMNPYATKHLPAARDWQDRIVAVESIFISRNVYQEFVQKVYEDAMKGKFIKKFMTAFLVNNDQKIDVMLSAKPVINNGHVEGMLLVGNDITEQLKTIQALEHSNERYDIVCKATNDMVWEWDLKTGEVYRNKDGWNRLFHCLPEQEIGTEKNWEERVHPDDLGNVQLLKEHINNSKGDEFFEIESRVFRADGSLAYIRDRGFVQRDEDGKPVRVIGAAQDITARKMAEKKLMEEQILKQHEITEAVIRAQENERQKIGGELHDNVNQILASSILYLNMAKKKQGDDRAELFEKANGMINDAITEIRKLSHSMIPPSLHVSSLTCALENLVETMTLAGNVKVQSHLTGFNEARVSEKLKLTIYRIVQEQFNNIMKYSGATVVELKLFNEHGDILLSISDNGKGFDVSKKAKGVGLMNIRTRASLHNGTVKIISAPQEGCAVYVHFPKQAVEVIELKPETVLYG